MAWPWLYGRSLERLFSPRVPLPLPQGSLLESIPVRDRPFIKTFLETQLFAVWCDQVIGSQVEGAR